MNQALEAAHVEHGLPFTDVEGSTLVSDLSRLERKTLGIVLGLLARPEVLVVDDADDLRATEHVDLLWSTLAHLLEDRPTALVASVQSATSAPAPSPRLHLLELDTRRTLDELMI
jgi:RND superfamily putative drug exporter